MRIVFEGADLTGKSTIAQLVAKELGVPYRGKISRVGPQDVQRANQLDFELNPNSVLDRCYWISDYIYEPLISGSRSEITKDLDEWNRLTHDNDTLYVFLVTAESVLTRRYEQRGDELQSYITIVTANMKYKGLPSDFVSHYIVHSTSSCTIEQSVTIITKQIQEVLNARN